MTQASFGVLVGDSQKGCAKGTQGNLCGAILETWPILTEQCGIMDLETLEASCKPLNAYI